MRSKRPTARPGSARARARTPPSRSTSHLPPPFQDYVDAVAALNAVSARFLIVGAYAMAAHGVPRATGALDVWFDPSATNAACVFEALVRFGAPLRALGITVDDLATPGRVCQIGLPPCRIDVTTVIDGVDFKQAWRSRLEGRLGPVPVSYLGRAALERNKAATGRAKDLADLQLLRARLRRKGPPNR
jgi:hypothetical protein